MQPSVRKLVSESEFLGLAESMDQIELIDGEVIVSPSPSPWHQLIVGRLYVALTAWARTRAEPAFIGLSPLDVRFAAGRILQPDLFVILGQIDVMRPGPIDRVPDLCIEIVSSDRFYDRVTKRLVYAPSGVREYWVVDHAHLVERWTGPGLTEAEEVTDRLTSPLLPGLVVDVPALFI